MTLPSLPNTNMGVSNKSVSWSSTFVTMVLQENRRGSDVPFLVQTFWTLQHHKLLYRSLSECPQQLKYVAVVRTYRRLHNNLGGPSTGSNTNSCCSLSVFTTIPDTQKRKTIWVLLETLNTQRDSSK